MFFEILIALVVLYFAINIAAIVYETRPAARQHDIEYQQRRQMERDELARTSKK